MLNAMAAEAEALFTCYFSRIPQETFLVGRHNVAQLSTFLIANAVIFNEIKLQIVLGGEVYRSYILKGMWEGKTTSQWYDDNIKIVEE